MPNQWANTVDAAKDALDHITSLDRVSEVEVHAWIERGEVRCTTRVLWKADKS